LIGEYEKELLNLIAVKWQRSGAGEMAQQRRWRNGAAAVLAERRNNGAGGMTQQRLPQNHLLHGAAVV